MTVITDLNPLPVKLVSSTSSNTAVSIAGTANVSITNAAVPIDVTLGPGNVDSKSVRVTLAADDPTNTVLGSITASAAPSAGTGDYNIISALKRILLNGASLLSRIPASLNPMGRMLVSTQNFEQILRDNFDATNSLWNTVTGTGDLVQLEGNALNSGWMVISKDPMSAGTTTTMTSANTFTIPFELSLGLHLSQRTYGQEFIAELVSTDTFSIPADVSIASIQQATTTLTVSTTAAHGLRPGMRIGIKGVTSDSRLNYPSLVVATTPSTTQFTATAGPQGTIASLSVGPFVTQGFVYLHDSMGGSKDGTSIIFDNATVTNATTYVRSGHGPDEFPMGGTVLGNHSITVGSTASVQAINAPGSYAFQPTTEFRMMVQEDRIAWLDAGVVDNVSTQPTTRVVRTQVVPDPAKLYYLRFRAVNLPSFTAVSGQIQTAAKTGTTTATVTAPSHGLTTGDWIVVYGARDTTNFANLTTATQVASVVDSNTFTIIWGAAVTATTFGGFFARVNGQQVLQGAITQVAQSVSRTSNIVTVVGSAAWTGTVIGDLVNLISIRDTNTGASLGLDGSYRVRDIQTTSIFLEPVGTAPTGVDIVSTNCGGGIVKRSDFRISFARLFDYERQRVEILQRGQLDVAGSLPVVINGSSAANISTNMAQIGGAAVSAATAQLGMNIVQAGGAVIQSSVSAGSTNRGLGVTVGTAVVQTDVSAGAFAGAGRVNGTVIASAQGGGAVVSAEVNVSALTLGTATSVIAILQESTGGTNFTDIWTSAPITATGIVRVPAIPVAGRRRWSFFSVGGTSTTVTVTITTHEMPPGSYPLMRQFYDAFAATNPFATLINNTAQTASNFVLTTLGTATTVWNVEGCKVLTFFMVLTGSPTVTTQPVVKAQGSMDGTNWADIPSITMTAAGNGMYAVTCTSCSFKYVRLAVGTAAVYSAGSYTISSIGVNGVN